MSLFLRISCMVLFLLCAHPGYAEESGLPVEYSLSLDDAVRLAYKNNKAIQIQEQEIPAAQADVLNARSGFIPQVNAAAGYTHNGSVLALPGTANPKKDPGIFSGYENENRAGIAVDQTLFSGGANTARLRQASVSVQIAQETLRARKLDTEFEVKRLYYGLLLAQESAQIAQSLLDQAKTHYDDVSKKYEQGTASKFDLLQSSVQVSKLAPEVINSRNAVDLIGAELKKLLGIEIRKEIVLHDSFSYSEIDIQEGEFLKTAYMNRPEIILAALGVDIHAWSIELAKSEDRPRVGASLGLDYRSNDIGDMFNDHHSNWNVGVAVRIPLFDGFSSKAKVAAAEARYAQAELSKEDLGEQVAVDIRKACLDLEKAKAIIDSQKDTIREAQEALRIAEVSYDNGEATNLDVLDAQVSLSQVRKNLSEGVYDYLMAEAFLNRVMGRSSLKGGAHEKN